MNRRIVLGILLTLVVVAMLAGIGLLAYDAGVSQGMVSSGKLTTPAPGTGPYPFYGGFFFPRPFGYGFGLLGCLFPLLLFFVIFGVLRMLFWRPWYGRGTGYGYGRSGNGEPSTEFDEWHRRAHATGQDKPLT
ncbi:MAG: hypothetical protein ACM3JD_06110 [Rudaea sp.]